MLVQLEAGNRRVTGSEPGYRGNVRDAVHAPRQSASRLHHDHRRLRQIVRLLRGAVHARAGAQPHQRQRASRKRAQLARRGLHRDPVAGAEREQLSRSVARGLGFRDAAGRTSGECPGSGACASPPRIRAISCKADCRCDRRESGAVQSRASAGAVRIDPHARRHAAALHARRVHAAHRVDEERAAPDRDHHRHHRRAFRARPKRTSRRRWRCSTRCEYDSIFSFKYSRRPNTPALALDDQIPEEEKTRRLTIVQEQQRAIQIRRNAAASRHGAGSAGGRLQQGHGPVDRADVAE